MKISYLQQENIDKTKWDKCIDHSMNGLVYAYSFYLDNMSENWDALILNDYEKVMPLTWKKKYSIYYLYQPAFTPSLGLFGNDISPDTLKYFFKNIPAKFKYWDFYLNRNNLFSIPDFTMYERHNYILSLSDNYETIKKNYAESHLRNIKRALKFGNTVKENIPLDDVIKLAKNQMKDFTVIEEKNFTNFKNLFEILKPGNQAATYGVYSPQNKLVASCVYFFSHQRAYYILVGNHPDGKTSGASHLLIDYFIKENAGKNLILDFEGSNLPSLAFFYKSFGATIEKYPGIRLNRLSGIAKLFKQ